MSNCFVAIDSPTVKSSLWAFINFQNQLQCPNKRGSRNVAHTTAQTNKAIERVLASGLSTETTEKNKYTTAFTPKDHVDIGQYAIENGNAVIVLTRYLKKKKNKYPFQRTIYKFFVRTLALFLNMQAPKQVATFTIVHIHIRVWLPPSPSQY